MYILGRARPSLLSIFFHILLLLWEPQRDHASHSRIPQKCQDRLSDYLIVEHLRVLPAARPPSPLAHPPCLRGLDSTPSDKVELDCRSLLPHRQHSLLSNLATMVRRVLSRTGSAGLPRPSSLAGALVSSRRSGAGSVCWPSHAPRPSLLSPRIPPLLSFLPCAKCSSLSGRLSRRRRRILLPPSPRCRFAVKEKRTCKKPPPLFRQWRSYDPSGRMCV